MKFEKVDDPREFLNSISDPPKIGYAVFGEEDSLITEPTKEMEGYSISSMERRIRSRKDLSKVVETLLDLEMFGFDYDCIAVETEDGWKGFKIRSIFEDKSPPGEEYQVETFTGLVRYKNEEGRETNSAVDMEEMGKKPDTCPECDHSLRRVRGKLYCENDSISCCGEKITDPGPQVQELISRNSPVVDMDHWMVASFFSICPKAFRPTDQEVFDNVFNNRCGYVYKDLMEDDSGGLSRNGDYEGKTLRLYNGSYAGTEKVFDANQLSKEFFKKTGCLLSLTDRGHRRHKSKRIKSSKDLEARDLFEKPDDS